MATCMHAAPYMDNNKHTPDDVHELAQCCRHLCLPTLASLTLNHTLNAEIIIVFMDIKYRNICTIVREVMRSD